MEPLAVEEPYPARGALCLHAPTSQSAISSVIEVSTPCAAVSTRGNNFLVLVLFTLWMYGMHCDPGMRL